MAERGCSRRMQPATWTLSLSVTLSIASVCYASYLAGDGDVDTSPAALPLPTSSLPGGRRGVVATP
ncbi:hypothetical protein E2562_005240 [Oryza meyeriana var. granulata]|uniref:Uncharacterized protein n=1 Tax=Oryza meyeriana var. granulata TaxID=110450 RepID=A0A6G1EER6_9ORYZ|nr:hypothetical protein E2562_005240 [Oryza meyeriana var. granulata]